MAWSDYKICDLCGNAKVFYDANIQDKRYQATWGEPSDCDPIGLKAICGNCNKTHEVVIVPREGSADLCADPALLAEAVEVLRGLLIAADGDSYGDYFNAIEAGHAFLAKLEGCK